jgi:ketosteroid isomerase-like protein
MPEESTTGNLDLVRSIFASWERGDAAPTGWVHPDVEFVIADGPAPGSWRGLGGMEEARRDWLSAWDELSVAAEEYRELDDGTVLVFTRLTGRGKTSGMDLGQMRAEGASLFQLSDGRVTRLVRYYDRARALADLGLAK